MYCTETAESIIKRSTVAASFRASLTSRLNSNMVTLNRGRKIHLQAAVAKTCEFRPTFCCTLELTHYYYYHYYYYYHHYHHHHHHHHHLQDTSAAQTTEKNLKQLQANKPHSTIKTFNFVQYYPTQYYRNCMFGSNNTGGLLIVSADISHPPLYSVTFPGCSGKRSEAVTSPGQFNPRPVGSSKKRMCQRSGR